MQTATFLRVRTAMLQAILFGVFQGTLIGPVVSPAKAEELDPLENLYRRHELAGYERAKAHEKKGAAGAIHALKTYEIEFELCFESKFEIACNQVVHDVLDLRNPGLKKAKLDLHLKKFKHACEKLESFYCSGLARTYASLGKPELALKVTVEVCEKNPIDGCVTAALELKKAGRTGEAYRQILRACEADADSCTFGLRYFSASPDVARFEERAKTLCPTAALFSSCEILGTYQLAQGRVAEAKATFLNGCQTYYRGCWLAAALELRQNSSVKAIAVLKQSCNESYPSKPSDLSDQPIYSRICSEVLSSGKISQASRASIEETLDWFLREKS